MIAKYVLYSRVLHMCIYPHYHNKAPRNIEIRNAAYSVQEKLEAICEVTNTYGGTVASPRAAAKTEASIGPNDDVMQLICFFLKRLELLSLVTTSISKIVIPNLVVDP